jgi:MoaA/NifB/PqqE/SkfB family radical SAM enzyme
LTVAVKNAPARRLPLARGPAKDDPALKKESFVDLLKSVLRDGGPGFAQFAVTNACNAACGFCGFSVDKLPRSQYVYVSLEDAKAAIDVFYKNGVRYMVFVGGEPLMHRDIYDMIRHAKSRGMQALICTNGGLFTRDTVDRLIDAGLSSCILSIDAAVAKSHEDNRRLPGVCEKIKEANERFAAKKVQTTASVTISRLVANDLERLPEFLGSLGFTSVTFSYPLRSLGSSYLSFSDNDLVKFEDRELLEAFDAITSIRKKINVVNASASVEEMKRFLLGKKQRFECYGGWKYFYLDWNLQLYRCHFWDKPMCSIWEFDGSQRVRDGCTKCMIDCYRDPSVIHHIGISIADATQELKQLRPIAAAKKLFTKENLESIGAAIEGLKWIAKV